MRPHGLGHAARHRALQQRIGIADRAAQRWQLAHQRWQDVAEALDRLAIGTLDLSRGAKCFNDEVDRTVLKMQAAVGQAGGNGAHWPPSSSRTLWARSTSSSVTARET